MATAIITVLLALVGDMATGTVKISDQGKPWLWALTALLAVIAVSMEAYRNRSDDRPAVHRGSLDDIADQVAQAVKVQWKQEETCRKIHDPFALRVRWHTADESLSDHWETIRKTRAPGRATPLFLAGRLEQVADAYRRIPSGRLVVLGRAGAGKTVLAAQLALDLLAERKRGDRVPVIFSVGSWCPPPPVTAGHSMGPPPSPGTPLREWIAQQLIRDNRGLALSETSGNATLAAALVDSDRILPILDGFDEIAAGLHRAALEDLNATDTPLVVTCRSNEYAAAVAGTDVLTAAACIELDDLTVDDLAQYLPRTVSGQRICTWDGILADLRDKPSDACSNLRKALATPLMVFLARTIYSDTPDYGDPGVLLDTSKFATSDAIKEHLFDLFIPAAYRPQSSKGCTAAKAERWLGFLAYELQYRQRGATNLAWWKLASSAPRLLGAISVGVIAGIAGAFGYPFSIGMGIGLMSAVLAGFLVRKWDRISKIGLARGLAGGISGGLAGALAAGALFGVGVRYNYLGSFLAGGLAFGVAVAPFARFVTGLIAACAAELFSAFLSHSVVLHQVGETYGLPAHIVNGVGLGVAAGTAVVLAQERIPARGLRWSTLGFFCGTAIGLLVGFLVWIQVGPVGGLLAGLSTTIGGAIMGGFSEASIIDLTKAATPEVVLARDRATFLRACFGYGIFIGLGTGLCVGFTPSLVNGLPNGFRVGLGVGLANMVTTGLAYGFLQASWGSFTLARWWLAFCHRLPWRLMTFLDEAHTNRSVLRQVGAVYQFRHVELQRRLARVLQSRFLNE